MDAILDVILAGLEHVFGVRWVAPFLFALPMLLWACCLWVFAEMRTRPYLAAMASRLKVLRRALGDDHDAVAERDRFRDNFSDVAEAMAAGGRNAEPLVLAWREFHESIIDETERPIRNTTRPSAFFLRVAPRQNGLVFWSNLLVGLGLLLTFLGLIVALYTARKGMAAGADPAAMQDSLRTLLAVAGAKFFTSVGGVGGSLILRLAERNLVLRTVACTESLCELLERGLLYVPPQRLAAEQLTELREQTAQLKTFNTDFALQVSERLGAHFQQAIAPVTASLATLNESMTGMGRSIKETLGESAGEVITQAAGAELRALGQTLSVLSDQLGGLSAQVGSSGDDAARQIRAAGADFAQAATDIREAFDRLAGQVDGMGGKLAEQGETVARAQDEALARLLGGLETSQRRSTEAVSEAVRALQVAGAQAAETMQKEVSAALANGVAESQRTFRTALEESGDSLRGTAGEITRAVGEAAEKIDRAGAGFVRSGESALRAAESMESVTGQARTAAVSLGDAAKDFATAAAPVGQAAQAIGGAADRVARAAEGNSEAAERTSASLTALADEIRHTQTAAEAAWADYRARFEAVDKALENTTVRLAETLGDSFDEFRRFAQSFDGEMASAVAKLANSVDAIEEYAESLDDYVEASRKPTLEAAE